MTNTQPENWKEKAKDIVLDWEGKTHLIEADFRVKTKIEKLEAFIEETLAARDQESRSKLFDILAHSSRAIQSKMLLELYQSYQTNKE